MHNNSGEILEIADCQSEGCSLAYTNVARVIHNQATLPFNIDELSGIGGEAIVVPVDLDHVIKVIAFTDAENLVDAENIIASVNSNLILKPTRTILQFYEGQIFYIYGT